MTAFAKVFVCLLLALPCASTGAAVFTVTSPANSGPGSLRDAIAAANNTAGDDEIVFQISGDGPHTIVLSEPLPPLASNITIINDRAGDIPVTVRKGENTSLQFEVFRVGSSNAAPTVLIAGLTISGGRGGSQGGGGIQNAASNLTLRNCTIRDNHGGAYGGGIHTFGTFNPGRLTLINCTMSGNTSEQAGGAIRNLAMSSVSEVILINSTFSGHTSGVILNEVGTGGTGRVTITNCTFANNRGVNSAQASSIANSGGAIEMKNSIFARQSVAGPNFTKGVSGSITSFGHNLADDAAGGDAGTGPGGFLNAAGDLRNTDPQLAELASNGGRTETHALLPASPAIDAGDDSLAPPRDQRRYLRAGRSDIGAFEFRGTIPVTLANLSTRLRTGTGDNILIGGFIVTGTQAKKVMLRAIGPSLSVEGRLQNPILELLSSTGESLARNDDWADAPNRQEIIDSTIPPTHERESAILITLPPGDYTASVRGAGDSTGIALVELYDLDRTTDSKLANIATRGVVQTGDNVMIGGFIVVGEDSQRVLLRGIGPSLSVAGRLQDPTLELYDGNGTLLQANDDWRSDQEAEIAATTIPPSNDREPAIVRDLTPAAYTAVIRGKGGTTGIAVVEAYALD